MAFCTGSDLLPQCLQGPAKLPAQVRDRKGVAGIASEHGTAMQGTRGSLGGTAKES